MKGFSTKVIFIFLIISIICIPGNVIGEQKQLGIGDGLSITYDLKKGDVIVWDWSVENSKQALDFKIKEGNNTYYHMPNATMSSGELEVPSSGRWSLEWKKEPILSSSFYANLTYEVSAYSYSGGGSRYRSPLPISWVIIFTLLASIIIFRIIQTARFGIAKGIWSAKYEREFIFGTIIILIFLVIFVIYSIIQLFKDGDSYFWHLILLCIAGWGLLRSSVNYGLLKNARLAKIKLNRNLVKNKIDEVLHGFQSGLEKCKHKFSLIEHIIGNSIIDRDMYCVSNTKMKMAFKRGVINKTIVKVIGMDNEDKRFVEELLWRIDDEIRLILLR